jgi:chemotaxis protein methyltransferase CheR
MNTLCDDFSMLDALRHRLGLQMGLHFPPERTPDLARGIELLAQAQGGDCSDDFIRHLLSSPLTKPQIQQLATRLTIGETYFFREPSVFDLLRYDLLPRIIGAQRGAERRIRLWSVGCSSGEEAYSLAILLHELLPPDEAWDALVLGMDINPEALQKAEAGLYGDWSFRNPPAGLRQQYFDRTGDGRYAIKPAIRAHVRFSYCNLADASAPMPLDTADLILCRNVLMYFVPVRASEAAQRLAHALKAGGWLLTTPAEASLIPIDDLESQTSAGHILYRKACDQVQASNAGDPWGSTLLKTRILPQKRAAEARSDRSATPETILTLANRGRLAEALNVSQRCMEGDSSTPDGYFLQATLLQELGRPSLAVSALEKVLDLDPGFVMAHVMLGGLHRQMRQNEAAMRHLHRAQEMLRRMPVDDVPPGADGLNAQRLECMVEGFLRALEQGV